MNLISTLIKIVHCFLIKIVHCFLYKQFLQFCIKLFSVHYLKKHKNHLSAIIALMLKNFYAENSEQLLWENSKQFYLMQKTDFMNAVSKFEYIVNMMCREQILLT